MIADLDVIVPVRNGGRLLRAAVDSVLAQEGVDVHVIVVDDGSTDGAVAALPRDPRLTTMRSDGAGIADALNTGIAAGRAPLVARQDADDESLPGRLVAEVELLDREPSIGLVATSFEVVVGHRVVTTMRPTPDAMLEKNPICAGSTVVRRDVLDLAGRYRRVFALSSDYDCWLRCEEVAGVAIIPAVGYRYRLSSSMATIRHANRQAAFADLARASARARRDRRPDPAADDAAADEVVTRVIDAHADTGTAVAAWWAREFAALGSRSDAIRCVGAAWAGLRWRERLGLTATALSSPTAQAEWS
jgi:glycosyltransferase involved in cell wall biosynthesis